MNTDALNQVLFSNPFTSKYFIGTFPACAPIRTRKRTYGFITNTDCHDRPGQHWCAWWIVLGGFKMEKPCSSTHLEDLPPTILSLGIFTRCRVVIRVVSMFLELCNWWVLQVVDIFVHILCMR
eukprot:sb/3475838/